MAMPLRPLDEFDLVAGGERHDRLLPVGAPPLGTAHPLLLPFERGGTDGGYLDVEPGLDGPPDLDLVGVRPDPERDGVLLFLLAHALFRHEWPDQDLSRRAGHWSGVREAGLDRGWPARGACRLRHARSSVAAIRDRLRCGCVRQALISRGPPRAPAGRRARRGRDEPAGADRRTRERASRRSATARCAPPAPRSRPARARPGASARRRARGHPAW